MAYGLTDQGFVRKPLGVIYDEIIARYQAVYGANFVVDPETAQGQIIAQEAQAYADLWELMEEAYNCFNLRAARGKCLDDLLQFSALTRNPGSATTGKISANVEPNTTITAGSIVEHPVSGEQFTVTETLLITVGPGSLDVVANNLGPINMEATADYVIVTPIVGWNSATYQSGTQTIGQSQESDEDARIRYFVSTAIRGQNIREAAQAQLLQLDGVTSAIALENDEPLPDANGLPGHSAMAIVEGGNLNDIGEVLMRNKVPGIPWVGTTNIPWTDSQGIPVNLNIVRPTPIDISVEVTITIIGLYPIDGDDQMKQAIVDYANGDLIQGRGFGPGMDIILSQLYTPVNTIPGHTVNSLKITSGGPFDVLDIPISLLERGRFLIANITVITL